MFVNRSGRNEQTLLRSCYKYFLSRFVSFSQAVSEEKILKKSVNQKQELPMAAMFSMDRNKMSIDASYKVSLHLVEGFQRRILKCEKLTDDNRRTTNARQRTTQDGRRTPSDG